MRKVIITVLIIVVNIMLQSTAFEYISVMGIKPQTAIAIIVCLSFMRGEVEGMFIGAFSGLLQDVLFSQFLGLHACLGAITGYLCGKFCEEFYSESVIIPAMLTLASVFLYEFVYYILMILTAGYVDILHFLVNLILPEVIYTTVISVFLYKFLYSLNERAIHGSEYSHRLF